MPDRMAPRRSQNPLEIDTDFQLELCKGEVDDCAYYGVVTKAHPNATIRGWHGAGRNPAVWTQTLSQKMCRCTLAATSCAQSKSLNSTLSRHRADFHHGNGVARGQGCFGGLHGALPCLVVCSVVLAGISRKLATNPNRYPTETDAGRCQSPANANRRRDIMPLFDIPRKIILEPCINAPCRRRR